MNKPIVRWTLGGPCSTDALDCLKLCIKNFKKFYGDQFRYFLCFNNTDVNSLKWTKEFNLELLDQSVHTSSLDIEPINNHSCWKLYPPRIDLNSYEIFIDNDINLHKKYNFNYFIEENKFFMAEAIKKAYGTFQNKINYQFKLNAGFFGVPPQFDFKKEINKVISSNCVSWQSDYFEEQGLVAYILHKHNCFVIDLDKIFICLDEFKVSEYGMHFVGLNKNNSIYWKKYKYKYKIL